MNAILKLSSIPLSNLSANIIFPLIGLVIPQAGLPLSFVINELI